jgi:hypothetical protein
MGETHSFAMVGAGRIVVVRQSVKVSPSTRQDLNYLSTLISTFRAESYGGDGDIAGVARFAGVAPVSGRSDW